MVCVRFCHVEIVTLEEASKLNSSDKTLNYGSFEFTLTEEKVVYDIKPNTSAV